MADDNILNIILRFLVDEKSKTAAKTALNDIGKSGAGTAVVKPAEDFRTTAQSIIRASKELNIPIEQAARNMAGLATGGFKTEQQILADVAAFQEMEAASNNVAKSVANIDKNVTATRHNSSMMMAGMTGFVISMTGMQLQKVGQGILSPIQDYTKYAGMASGVSARWLTTQQEIQTATVRIGGALAESVLPAMEGIADAAMKVADWMEQNPALAKAAAMFAGGAITTGTLLLVGGQLMSSAAAFAQLMQMVKGTTFGAKIAAAAPAAVGVGLPVGGAIAGEAALMFSANRLGAYLGEKVGLGTYQEQLARVGQAATVGAYYLGGLVGKQNEWALSVGKLLGVIDTASTKTENAASQIQVDAFVKYQNEQKKAEQDYQDQRTKIIEDAGQQVVEATQKYEADRAKLIAAAGENATKEATALYRQEQQAEQDYYLNQTKVVRDAGRQAERAQEDHLHRMAELQAAHDQRITDLAAERDALGMVREMQSYERQRSDAERQYQVETARRNQDLAIRLSDMDQEFQQERARRMQNYQLQRQEQAVELQQQLKDLDANHKAEMAQIQAQEQKKLNDLRIQFNKEQAARYTAFAQQLRDLNAFMGQETQLRTQYYDYWTKQFQAFVAGNKDLMTTAYPTRDSGGYVDRGLYMMKRGEYVLTDTTTAMLEKLAGSKLSQAAILGLTAGGGGGMTIHYYDQKRIDGRVTASDKRMITQASLSQLAEVLNG